MQYANDSKDELPLYVFDKRFAEKCPQLGEEYHVPDVFPASEYFQLIIAREQNTTERDSQSHFVPDRTYQSLPTRAIGSNGKNAAGLLYLRNFSSW